MKIGVPGQTNQNEARVAITPDVAQRLSDVGHVLVVEAGAGSRAN